MLREYNRRKGLVAPRVFVSPRAPGERANGDILGTDMAPIDPQLKPLDNYGGPTMTLLPEESSPAIGAGDPTGAPDWDQRGPGYPRTINGMIDIGSVERQPDDPPNPSNFARPERITGPATTLLAGRLSSLADELRMAENSRVGGRTAQMVHTARPASALEHHASVPDQGRTAGGLDQGHLDTFFRLSTADVVHDLGDLSDMDVLPSGF